MTGEAKTGLAKRFVAIARKAGISNITSRSRWTSGRRTLAWSDGSIEHVAGATDMVTGRSQEFTRYFPEPVNRKDGAAMTSETKDQNHMANWIDCIRSRKTPNAPVEIGYRSAVAAHMANMAYRQKQRVTLEMAKASKPQF